MAIAYCYERKLVAPPDGAEASLTVMSGHHPSKPFMVLKMRVLFSPLEFKVVLNLPSNFGQFFA